MPKEITETANVYSIVFCCRRIKCICNKEKRSDHHEQISRNSPAFWLA